MNPLRNLTLFQIELVAEIARSTGIRDLGRHFDLDPAIISRRLKDIEEALGVSIVVRSKNGIQLTSQGEEASRICAALFSETSALLELKATKSPYSGYPLVTIGSRGFFNVSLSRVLAKTALATSRTRWRFVDSSPDDLLRGCLAGAVDVAIHFETWTWPKSWQSQPSAKLTWGLLARDGHPLKKRCRIEDVKKYPFVVASYLHQDKIVRAGDIFSLKWRERILGHEAQTAATMRSIILSSDHLAFVPLITVEDDLRDRTLKVLSIEKQEPVVMALQLTFNPDKLPNHAYKQLDQALTRIDEVNTSLSKALFSAEDLSHGTSIKGSSPISL